jgi:ATP10 protein
MSRNRRIFGDILFTVALALLMPAWTIHGQPAAIPLRLGDPLPDVTGQSLSGNPAHLSTMVEGKIALVVFSFSKAGGKDTQLWDRDLLRDFGSNRSVALSTVIMLESAPRLLRGVIVSRLKNDMPPSLHNSTIVSYEDEKLWKQHLDVLNDSRAYVVLLGQDGRIRWMSSGGFSDAEYEQLKAKIEKQR